MNDFEKLLLDTLKKVPEIQAFIARVEQVEAAVARQSAQPAKGAPAQTLAIPRKELVRQIGGPMVRHGEVMGILRPIVSNGGKGPKKRYPREQVEALLQHHSSGNKNRQGYR